MLFQLVQVVYWLALSTWFGGVLFIAISAPVILKTVREQDPLLPRVLSVNLEAEHGTLLAGTIIGNLVSALARIELICAGLLLITLIAQWVSMDIHNSSNFALLLVRSALLIAATVIEIYDWRILWPKILKTREEFIEHADEPEVANPLREQFDRLQRDSFTLLTILVALLLAMILFSANVHSPPSTLTPISRT
jgi:hypothetical protein